MPALAQMASCRLFGTKALPGPMVAYFGNSLQWNLYKKQQLPHKKTRKYPLKSAAILSCPLYLFDEVSNQGVYLWIKMIYKTNVFELWPHKVCLLYKSKLFLHKSKLLYTTQALMYTNPCPCIVWRLLTEQIHKSWVRYVIAFCIYLCDIWVAAPSISGLTHLSDQLQYFCSPC